VKKKSYALRLDCGEKKKPQVGGDGEREGELGRKTLPKKEKGTSRPSLKRLVRKRKQRKRRLRGKSGVVSTSGASEGGREGRGNYTLTCSGGGKGPYSPSRVGERGGRKRRQEKEGNLTAHWSGLSVREKGGGALSPRGEDLQH